MSSFSGKNRELLSDFQQDLEVLREIHFFSEFPLQVLKILAYLCGRGDFSPGEIVLEQGEDRGQALYIVSGSLVLVRGKAKGQEPLMKYGAGDFLGGFSLLGPIPALFTVKAETGTSVLTINREQFQKVMEQFPEVRQLALKAMLHELHRWEQKNFDERDGHCLHKVGVTLL